MDYSVTSSNSGNESSNGFFNGGYIQQQNNATSIPYATPIALSGNISYESSSGYGNSWIGPALHTFQTHAKTNLFQTPIFGMEWAHNREWESVQNYESVVGSNKKAAQGGQL